MTTLLNSTMLMPKVSQDYGTTGEDVKTNVPTTLPEDIPSDDEDALKSWDEEKNVLPKALISYFLNELPLDAIDAVQTGRESELTLVSGIDTEYKRHAFRAIPGRARIFAYDSPARPKREEYPIVEKFAKGLVDSETPTTAAIGMASRITRAAHSKTIQPEISVDIDGALSFDLRLSNGLLLIAELDVEGTLEALLIDDEHDVIVKRLPDTDEKQIIALFE